MDRRDGRRQMHEVRELLMEWDAVGVADEPQAADEYDCMIGPLLRHLRNGADAALLHDWISRQLVDHFGLTPRADADRALAEALVSWHEGRKASQPGP